MSNRQDRAGLIRWLGSSIYGDGREAFQRMDEESRRRFFRECSLYRLEAYCYYVLKNELPVLFAKRWQEQYHLQAAAALRTECELKSLFMLLETNRIRFAPLKGVDLAYRAYPSPALRTFGDWDILFHPDDCDRMLTVLSNAGWSAPYQRNYQHLEHHHFAPHYKNGRMLEPHWTLPRFQKVPPFDLWNYIVPERAGAYAHHLSPELNLLLLSRHMAACDYRHASIPKFLLDTAFLLRLQPLDWAVLRNMVQEWRMPYPGDLLAAWPEFFPEALWEAMRPEISTAIAFRKLFDMREECRSLSSAEWVMSRNDRGTFSWYRNRLEGLAPWRIRIKYQLPAQGACRRLLIAYCRDLGYKLSGFFRLRRNPQAKQYFNMLHAVDDQDSRR